MSECNRYYLPFFLSVVFLMHFDIMRVMRGHEDLYKVPVEARLATLLSNIDREGDPSAIVVGLLVKDVIFALKNGSAIPQPLTPEIMSMLESLYVRLYARKLNTVPHAPSLIALVAEKVDRYYLTRVFGDKSDAVIKAAMNAFQYADVARTIAPLIQSKLPRESHTAFEQQLAKTLSFLKYRYDNVLEATGF